jgi:site-specific recombinase XerD
MIKVKLVLDSRRIKKDGTYPVVIRLFHQRKSLALSTDVSIMPQYWDEQKCSVRKSYPQSVLANSRLSELELELKSKIHSLSTQFPSGFTYDQLKAFIHKGDVSEECASVTVQSFWQQELKHLITSRRFGSARVYKFCFELLSKEASLDIPFESVSYSYLKDIEAKLLKRGTSVNSISVYMRSFRAIYNMAINKDIVNASYYPFRKYRIKSEKTVPHVLPLEQMSRFFQLNLDAHHPYYKSWLLGKLSFLLCGINFTDLCMLTAHNIKNGRIIYKRAKTKKLYSILLLSETAEILDKLKVSNNPSLCAVLQPAELNSGEKLPYIIRDRNKQFNKQLSLLGKMIGCEINIRSYTFRYTIANLCKQLGYDIGKISELLGHNYGLAVTSGYLLAYDKKELDQMLQHVYDVVASKCSS